MSSPALQQDETKMNGEQSRMPTYGLQSQVTQTCGQKLWLGFQERDNLCVYKKKGEKDHLSVLNMHKFKWVLLAKHNQS